MTVGVARTREGLKPQSLTPLRPTRRSNPRSDPTPGLKTARRIDQEQKTSPEPEPHRERPLSRITTNSPQTVCGGALASLRRSPRVPTIPIRGGRYARESDSQH